MPRSFGHATAWLRRHALPSIAATVIALGVAGGGVTYALAGHPAAAATPMAATPTTAGATPSARAGHSRSRHAAAAAIIALLTRDTGQSLTAIRAQLQTGRSLDDIAGATAAARFESDVLAQLRAHLDKAVAAKRITSAQESAALAKAKTFVEKLMAEPGTTLLQQMQHLGQLGTAGQGTGARAPASSSTT